MSLNHVLAEDTFNAKSQSGNQHASLCVYAGTMHFSPWELTCLPYEKPHLNA